MQDASYKMQARGRRGRAAGSEPWSLYPEPLLLTLPAGAHSLGDMRSAEEELRILFGGRLDRRRFLKGSLGGLALLGAGSVLPAGCRSYPKPQTALRSLTPTEYAILNTVAGRMLGATGHVGAGPQQIDVAANVDAMVATWDGDARAQLRTMLRVFEHGTYLFDLQRKRFTRLSAAQQDAYLAGWMNSTLGARRIVFRALKALVAAGFYQDPRSWRRLGYDGPWLGRVYATERVAPEPATALPPGGLPRLAPGSDPTRPPEASGARAGSGPSAAGSGPQAGPAAPVPAAGPGRS